MPPKKKSSGRPAKAAKRAKPPAAKKKTPAPKPAVKPVKPAAKNKTPAPKPVARKREAVPAIQPLDLSAFPPETITALEKSLCLACVSDVFTRHLRLTPRAAHLEIKRYTPSLQELYASTVARPWFTRESPQDACPYCGSAAKWHTRLMVYRIESGKATDTLRRDLVKRLPQSGEQFVVLEEKASQQHAFFEWLEKISTALDLDDPVWLRDISRHYLGRKEPKTDWHAQFQGLQGIRRSRRLESGWEVDGARLFLAPMLFDELLLVQYLISRSHRAGGLTLEGRYTLPELFARLRNAGYLRFAGIHTQNPGDALEQLVVYLGGGEAAIKFYHILDRRDFLQKLQNLKDLTPPKPKRLQP